MANNIPTFKLDEGKIITLPHLFRLELRDDAEDALEFPLVMEAWLDERNGVCYFMRRDAKAAGCGKLKRAEIFVPENVRIGSRLRIERVKKLSARAVFAEIPAK